MKKARDDLSKPLGIRIKAKEKKNWESQIYANVTIKKAEAFKKEGGLLRTSQRR